MLLTGKAKKRFELWWDMQPNSYVQIKYDKSYLYLVYGNTVLVRLDSIPESMLWGLYQDWANSMNICLFVKQDFDGHLNYLRGYIPFVGGEAIYKNNDCFETNSEARKAAIDRLNELINKD